MERDPYEGGSDVGLDLARDLGAGTPGAIRDAAPDVLAPIDAGQRRHADCATVIVGRPARFSSRR